MHASDRPKAPTPWFTNDCLIAQVSGSESDHASLSGILRNSGWEIQHLRTIGEAREWLISNRAAAVITEATLRDGCWKDILGLLQQCSDRSNLIVSSRLADERLWAEVINLGGYDLLITPFAADEVLHTLSVACRESQFSIAPQSTQASAKVGEKNTRRVRVAGAD